MAFNCHFANIKRRGNNGVMSPAVNISAELSPGEIYARLAWIKGLTVELLAGNVVVRSASPGEHTRRIWRLTTALMAPATAMDAAVFVGRATPYRPRWTCPGRIWP